MRLLAILVLLIQLGFPPLFAGVLQSPDNSDSDKSVLDAGTQVEFGKKIVFHAKVLPAAEISEVLVSFTPEGHDTYLEKMELGIAGEVFHEVLVDQLPLAPFSQISFFFEAQWKDGGKSSSEVYLLEYNDTRYTWQTVESGIFQVSWYGEDSTLGQEIINVAKSGLDEAQGILPADPPVPLRIYAYDSSSALQEALKLTGDIWVAGHTSPELGLILISVPSGPEKKLELQRQIPHEIMHLLQYQITGKNFTRQPIWLTEGMASLAELYPNPEYGRVLKSAAETGKFIPLSDLCSTFPSEASPAFQAYAQSESFVRFLHKTFEITGLHNLVDQYQNGLGCAEGISAAFGSSLGQLEYRWKQEVLGVNAGRLAASRLGPYMLLGLLLLVPVTVSIWSVRPGKRTTASCLEK